MPGNSRGHRFDPRLVAEIDRHSSGALQRLAVELDRKNWKTGHLLGFNVGRTGNVFDRSLYLFRSALEDVQIVTEDLDRDVGARAGQHVVDTVRNRLADDDVDPGYAAHLGAQGIEEGLPAPKATEEDLSVLDSAALRARGYVRLPQSLEEALDRFRANAVVTGWFPQGFADVYVLHKKGERAFLGERSQAEICALYEQVY